MLLQAILVETARTFFLAAPFMLLGLLIAGLMHVLVPQSFILRWMGGGGLAGVSRAALIGVPLPVCSCGVVPIAVELRRKGASTPASLSFLTTTPESSVDSILLTWGLMGPVLAIARPIAAFFTAVLGGILAIAYLPLRGRLPGDDGSVAHDHDHDHGHSHGHHHDEDCGEDACDDHAIVSGDSDVARASLKRWFLAPFRRQAKTEEAPPSEGANREVWRRVVRPTFRYGFGELLDDLAFWLVLGVLAAGVLGALVPADLASRGLGGGLVPMLLMLAVGVPIYMCASASTPVAAALMAKGLGPGAALVFLLAGPATNAATLVLLARTFGGRFVRIYLVSVVLGALAAGFALEALIVGTGLTLAIPSTTDLPAAFELSGWLSTPIRAAVLLWRLGRGAWRQGWRELVDGFAGMVPSGWRQSDRWRAQRRRLLLIVLVLAALGYLATGLRTVPPDSRGYGFTFGSLTQADLGPGLHYVPPAPLGGWEARRTEYARKADIGFRTDLESFARRKELARYADRGKWHSAVAAMNTQPEQASYLTADENLVEMSLTVHYGLRDASAFFYRLDHQRDLVGLYAEATARELLASLELAEILTERRPAIEEIVAERLQESLDALEVGVEVRSVHIVDVHPPTGAVFAFRDVSSATENRETRIHRAREAQARELPRARGEAAALVTRAGGDADAARTVAEGEAEAFAERTRAVAQQRRLLLHLLWLESAERTLEGRRKYILPPGAGADSGLSLWRSPPPPGKTSSSDGD